MYIAIPFEGRVRTLIRSSFLAAKRTDATHYSLTGESFQMSGVTAEQVILLPDSVEVSEGQEVTDELLMQALPVESFITVSADEALPNVLGLLLRQAVADGRISDAELLSVQPVLEGRIWRAGIAVQVGDVVQIRSMGVKATVLAISSDRTLTLQAGILRVTAREDEVLLLENEKPAVTVRTESRGTALRQSAVSSELDIRGMETIEAIPVVERYIDSAVQSRLETVTIIHGKGTGALRAAVQQSLRRNKQVKSFRLGRYGEGETGVTVVELK